MFESFVITLREGIEVALIVGLVWVYLRKIDRPQLLPAVLWGLGLGVVASVGLAAGIQQLDLSGALVEGTMMFLAAAFVGSMVVWMMLHARSVGRDIRERVDALAQRSSAGGAFWGLLLFTAVMVAREGFETVVFLAAVWRTHEAMLGSYLGAAAGLFLAAGFAVAFIRGSVHIDLGRFFKITGIVLMIFLVQVIAYGMHEYDEAGLMNWMPDSLMAVIHQIAAQNVLFILAILAIPILMLLVPGTPGTPGTPGAPGTRTQVSGRERAYRLGGVVAGVVVLAVIGGEFLSVQVQAAQAEHPLLRPEAGKVELELADLTPGQAQQFDVPEDGRRIPLIALLDDASTLHLGTPDEIEPGDRFEFQAGHLVRLEADGEVEPMTPVPFTMDEPGEAYIDVERLESLAAGH